MSNRKKVSIKSVAAEAGVTLKTVYRVVNNETSVAEGTRAKIENLLRAKGYRLPYSKRRVCVVVLDVADNDFMREIAVRVQRDLTIDSVKCYFVDHANDSQNFFASVADADVVVFCSFPDEALIAAARKACPDGMLINLFGGASAADVSIDADDTAGGVLAARHLFANGHRRHVAVATTALQPNPVDRMKSFCAEMKLLAPDCKIKVIDFPGFGYTINDTWDKYLSETPQGQLPSAIFCTIGAIAERFPVYLERRTKLTCPNDIGLLSYDDLAYLIPTDAIVFDKMHGAYWIRHLVDNPPDRIKEHPIHMLIAPRLITQGSVKKIGSPPILMDEFWA